MLTLDLLRVRVNGNIVTPIYLTTSGGRKYLDIAAGIIAVYHAHVGNTLGELAQALDDLAGSSTDIKVYRGLAKILHDSLLIVPPGEIDVAELRRTVFTLAARAGPLARTADLLFPHTVSNQMADIAVTLGMDEAMLRASLYADLKDRQRILAVDRTLTQEALIQRYNTALAQAMVYRATRMVLDVYDNYRLLFKYLKLARLMHSIAPLPGGDPQRGTALPARGDPQRGTALPARGYRIDIDGPDLALHTQRALRHRHGQPDSGDPQVRAVAHVGESARRAVRKRSSICHRATASCRITVMNRSSIRAVRKRCFAVSAKVRDINGASSGKAPS